MARRAAGGRLGLLRPHRIPHRPTLRRRLHQFEGDLFDVQSPREQIAVQFHTNPFQLVGRLLGFRRQHGGNEVHNKRLPLKEALAGEFSEHERLQLLQDVAP